MKTLSIKQRITIVGIYFVISTLFGIILNNLVLANIITGISSMAFAQFLMMLVIAIVYIVYLKRELIKDFVVAQNLKSFFVTCLKYFALIFLVMYAVNFILYMIGIEGTSLNQVGIEIMAFDSPVIIFLTVVVLAPFIEELVFRYAIIFLDSKSTFTTLLTSALVFGYIHIAQSLTFGNFHELWFILLYGGLGFVLGLSYVKTKTIMTPIVVHAMYNLVGFLSIFFING